MNNKFAIIFFVAALCSAAVCAQETTKLPASARLEAAEILYEEGKLELAAEQLDTILSQKTAMRSLSREGKAEVYRLAALSNYMLEKADAAKLHTKKMLAYRPNYGDEIHANDIELFRNTVNSMKALPRISIGAKVGSSMLLTRAKTSFPVLQLDEPERFSPNLSHNGFVGKYSDDSFFLNFQFGLESEFAVSKALMLNFSPSYIRHGYQHTQAYNFGLNTQYEYQYIQTLDYIELPLMIRYQPLSRLRIRPFVEGGIYVKFLQSANRKTTESPITDLPVGIAYNLRDNGVMLGLGGAYYFKSSAIKLNLRYGKAYNETTDKNMRLINDGAVSSFVYGYYDSMSSYLLNYSTISVSYVIFLSHRVFDW